MKLDRIKFTGLNERKIDAWSDGQIWLHELSGNILLWRQGEDSPIPLEVNDYLIRGEDGYISIVRGMDADGC